MRIKGNSKKMHETKNFFMKWLKKNKATEIEMFCGEEDDDFDYYRSIDYFIGEEVFVTTLTVFEGREIIDHDTFNGRYRDINIDEFLKILKDQENEKV